MNTQRCVREFSLQVSLLPEPDDKFSGMKGARPSLSLAVVPVTVPGTLGGTLEGESRVLSMVLKRTAE